MSGRRTDHAPATLSVLVSVRCLECGEIYPKPVQGGTVKQNPGCPSCGYVGWLPVTVPAPAPLSRRRSAAGLRRGRPARSS
jgi:predicted  nucleic acid-binding Zn-ribbon protein